MKETKVNSGLSGEEINKEVIKRVQNYDKLSFLEKYAMYMGKAQILEYGLKNLLYDKFKYSLDKMEKWTLGRTKNELRDNEVREDFVLLLEEVVEKRNYIAHELLMNDAIYKAILKNSYPKDHYSKDQRILDKAIYELEQIMFLFDLTQEMDAWT